MTRRRRSSLLALAATLLLAAAPLVRADERMPTPEECATGQHNGVWLVGEPGRGAVCVGAEGTSLAYVGGNPAVTCGRVVVAGQEVSSSHPDPNRCPGGPGEIEVETIHAPVTMSDGVVLDGTVRIPKALTGHRVPVVLQSSPYFGSSLVSPDHDFVVMYRTTANLLAHGYAVASYNVRGTGASGGCFGFMGRREQRDQAELVEWLGTRPWSTGDVAMIGASYDAATALAAAVQQPRHLRAIVIAGIVEEQYTLTHSPQGAAMPLGPRYSVGYVQPGFVARNGVAPPVLGTPDALLRYLGHARERVCDETARVATAGITDSVGDDRDEPYWAERSFRDRLGEVRAATLIGHGFGDRYGATGHAFQEDEIWSRLTRAPKRMMLGPWGHQWPDLETNRPGWAPGGWDGVVIEWLDRWMRPELQAGSGAGRPARVGTVDFLDSSGVWRSARSWPPAPSGEVRYLSGASLAAAPEVASARFVSVPQPRNVNEPGVATTTGPNAVHASPLCPDPLSAAGGTTGLSWSTAPQKKPVLVAGNPVASLRLSSTSAGGLVSLQLVDLAPGNGCDAAGRPTGARLLSVGAADLRFLQRNFVAEPFPVGIPVTVRVDLSNLAHVVQPGHRLALLASFGDMFQFQTAPKYTPELTVSGDGTPASSHLVVPVLKGTLAGRTS